MKALLKNNGYEELFELCDFVRTSVYQGNYDSCIDEICEAMESYPHAPHPHNLLGIILEKKGDHSQAMKHFRAAWALDPSYLPARHNLETYGTFLSEGHCAFDEADLSPQAYTKYEVIYNERGIGHIVSKNKVEYDEHGIGHIVRR